MNRYAYADVISYRCRFPVLSKHFPHNSHFMQLTKTPKSMGTKRQSDDWITTRQTFIKRLLNCNGEP